ncbi:MAG: glutamate--tRNA ligase [Candidatus Micrarchaeota archaeon]
MDGKILESIRKHALKNAYDYGQANPSKVMGRVLGEFAEEKANAKEIMAEISREAGMINSLSKEEIGQEMQKYDYGEQGEKQKAGAKEAGAEGAGKKIILPGAIEGKTITRFTPEPGGHLHIGHAKALFLGYEGALNHGGQMRLRMDDTNPQKAKREFVEGIVSSIKWLGIKWRGEITYSSDYMGQFYELANELIMKSCAYVCNCSQDKIKEGREKKMRCDCAARMPAESVAEFKKMCSGEGYAAGDAILRYKGDMKAQNTVMRDPTLFRIIDGAHFRQGEKYKCWPNYDFAVAVVDSLEGITHAMRSKEYELRDELYYSILENLEMRKPLMISFSRLAIKGAPVSKRLITPLIEEGKVSGYDDIRLPTLIALKRRGIQPAAIRNFVLSFGLSKVESEPGWDKLLSENRKLIDGEAQRRFFVPKPARVHIQGAPAGEIEVKNHPHEELGARKITASSLVYIPSADAQALSEGEVFRLKDWCNVKLLQKGGAQAIMPDGKSGQIVELKCEFVSLEGTVQRKVQWVCDENKVAAKVDIAHDLYVGEKFNENSLEEAWGWGERSLNFANVGDIFQFERFGFVRLDVKGESPSFVFISK